ncbi:MULTISPECIES: elongation factor P 5-aminopentanone reductase [Lactobacillus]|uniref:SDR family NAD(P)-dependent oxidoreductase n=1 Tax=Lactobacillus xujianguonis TaxID=2495899 RepID=A0A437SSJ5_9LACO|nr:MULTISPECIES: SDR family NAD(P)-dependent oxidoreductase [Lactobacillus]RVU69929.1 SDR family NAD(P)-dependent oxidoreductase [Lactobacillus xujianguonis]RVU72318.1 SDR family NAD(P)-dependent oxidoreductase [Lactobacillus xujianguonis]
MRRAIVFGATGGIGQSICHSLAAAGWSFYVHCNQNWDAACQLSQELMQEFPQQDFMPIKLDFLAKDDELKQFTQHLLPINAVVFAQGITNYSFLGEQKLSEIERIIQVNLTVPIKLTKLLEAQLIKQDFSRIVYLGSVYGGQGSALESVYSATKAGLTRFSQAYAREVASAGLTVNVVAPGAVDTPMNAMFSPETMQEVKAEIPAGRLAQGEDIAFWVKTLLDERSSYCTGQTIYVTGGWLL